MDANDLDRWITRSEPDNDEDDRVYEVAVTVDAYEKDELEGYLIQNAYEFETREV